MSKKSKAETPEVEVARLHTVSTELEQIALRFSGDRLMVNRFDEKVLVQMVADRFKIPQEVAFAKPAQACEDAKYKNVLGQECFPVLCFRRAMVDAAPFAGKTKKAIAKTDLRGSFWVKGDLAPIVSEHGGVLDFSMVRSSGMNRAPMPRFRPLYTDWHCDVVVQFAPHLISVDSLYHLATTAGQSVGVGEWRVQKMGSHGVFDTQILDAKEVPRILKETSIPRRPMVLPKWFVAMLEDSGETVQTALAKEKRRGKSAVG